MASEEDFYFSNPVMEPTAELTTNERAKAKVAPTATAIASNIADDWALRVGVGSP